MTDQTPATEAGRLPAYTNHYAGDRSQTWRTPQALFDAWHYEFAFDLDGAATSDNALLSEWSDPTDGTTSWEGRRVFCNPPWKRIPEFVELADTADLAVLLVPARVNARWFHRALQLGAEVRYFLGRPNFGGARDKGHNSPVDCLLLVFRS